VSLKNEPRKSKNLHSDSGIERKYGLIWYTDRGSQYASKLRRTLLAQHKIKQSMSGKGDC
jgi:transposase InsO family protein